MSEEKIESEKEESKREEEHERELTLGESNPSIADDFYRNVYSQPYYRYIKSQISKC